jgi:hypothetical protein
MIAWKKILGSFLLPVLTVIIISLLILPAHAGVSPAVGRAIDPGGTAIIGETNLRFVDSSGSLINDGSTWVTIKGPISGPENIRDSVIIKFNSRIFDTTLYDEPDEKKNPLVQGTYNVSGGGTVEFVNPRLNVKVDRDVVIPGIVLNFTSETNLGLIAPDAGPNYISFCITGPDDIESTQVGATSLENVNVNVQNRRTIYTSDLKEIGNYTVCIKPDPETNNGLGKEEKCRYGPAKPFKLIAGLSLTPNKEKAEVSDEIQFTVRTASYTNVNLDVTTGDKSTVTFIGGKGNVKASGHSCSGKTDINGEFKAVARFTHIGSYQITATDGHTKDKKWVKITPVKATLDKPKAEPEPEPDREPPERYYIGDALTIKGEVPLNADSVLIKVDGTVVATLSALEFNDKGYIWNTQKLIPGSHTIGVWILPFSDPEKDYPDQSVSVILLRGGLRAELSAEFVALGEKFNITTDAAGRDLVDILTIAPKGGSGKGLDPTSLDAPGLTYSYSSKVPTNLSTSDELKVSRDSDTGTYQIVVLNPGRDGVYGTSGSGDLLKVLTNGYSISLAVKTSEQIMAMLYDRTVYAAGSDDLLWLSTIKVEAPFLSLDALSDVALGEKITALGTTNREKGTEITVSVDGPTELIPQIATVRKDDSVFYNTFSVDFDTVSAQIGAYSVIAEDNFGHDDSGMVNIVSTVEPPVTVTPTPEVETPEPTPEPTPTPMATQNPIPTPVEAGGTGGTGSPPYHIAVIIAVVAAAGIYISYKVKEWYLLKRYNE